MGASEIIGLLGGIALFLFGMAIMGDGLKKVAGSKLELVLYKLTSTPLKGVLLGTGVTAVIQSSSAVTVMAVGFVNSGIMALNQVVGIIMGANIGTTITGQLIALDVGALAPLFAFIGVAMVVFVKMPRAHHIGQIMAGLGVLFIGMEMMSSSMMPLRDSQAFVDLMTRFSNPLLGIAVGACLPPCIQSSSASVGILRGSGHQRCHQLFQFCVHPLWPEYRYLYHCGPGLHRHQPQRQTCYYHPPDVQHHRHGALYYPLHPVSLGRSGGLLYP